MADSHASSRLKVFGNPEVTKLYNDRYRITVRCDIQSKTQDWYYDNRADLWRDFGDLYTAPLNIDDAGSGWEPREGEAYPDQVLIQTSLEFIPQRADPVLVLIYETLTSSFVQETDDVIDYEANNLKRLTRTVIATESASYSNVVGTTTLVDGAETLTLAGYTEDKKGADEGGFTRIQEVWVEAGILNISQEFNNGRGKISVQVINLTEPDVDAALSEVTSDHILIGQSDQNYEGLKTTTYQYELDESYVEDYELNGLKRITLIELSAGNHPAYTFSDTASVVNPTSGLYLASQNIDNGGTVKVRESVWLQSGKLFEREKNPSDGIKSITTGWWKVVGATVGPIIERSTENYEGFEVYTVTTMNSPDGSDLVDGANDKKVASFETLTNWTRPGVVGLQTIIRVTGTSATSVKVWQRAPVQMKVRAHVEVYISKSPEISDTGQGIPSPGFDAITGGSNVKLWNPDSWPTLDGSGVDDWYAPSINRTYRGFRIIDPTDNDYDNTSTTRNISESSTATTGNEPFGTGWYNPEWFGRFLPIGDVPDGTIVAEAELAGGPEKPEGKIWMLDVQNPKAFTDVDGVDYYKKTYVWSYIPDFENGEDIWDDA